MQRYMMTQTQIVLRAVLILGTVGLLAACESEREVTTSTTTTETTVAPMTGTTTETRTYER